jgi:hypothetical protein
MKTEKEQLAECRAHWEATKPDAVFPDYWLGWKAARESIVVQSPTLKGCDSFANSSHYDNRDMAIAYRDGHMDLLLQVEAAGVKVMI